MSAVMYGASGDGDLAEMRETLFEKELDLQEFLSKHPELLAGDQMNAANARRFVLISAEAGVAIAEGGSDYFSLDHLFVDQDGIPTLVEVKRSTDTRLRREVVGQMLEYAANACAFWDPARLRLAFERRCETAGVTPEAELAKLGLGPDIAGDVIWDKLAQNLKQERLRLVFLADKFPPETLRIVEFLNRQMTATEVYAVEVRHFTGGGLKTLVPRVLNPSLLQVERKAAVSGPGEEWTEDRFYAALEERHPESVQVFREIANWANGHTQLTSFFGNGRIDGSIIICFQRTKKGRYDSIAGDVAILTLWTYGRVEIDFQYLLARAAFASREARLELLRRLTEGSSLALSENMIDKRPSLPSSQFDSPENLRALLGAMEWVVQTLSAAS